MPFPTPPSQINTSKQVTTFDGAASCSVEMTFDVMPAIMRHLASKRDAPTHAHSTLELLNAI